MTKTNWRRDAGNRNGRCGAREAAGSSAGGGGGYRRGRTVGVFCSFDERNGESGAVERVKRIVVRGEGDVMRFCEYDPRRCVGGFRHRRADRGRVRPSEIDLVTFGTAFTPRAPLRPRRVHTTNTSRRTCTRESRVCFATNGRGAACGAARRGDGLHNNGLNDGCERVCSPMARRSDRRGTALLFWYSDGRWCVPKSKDVFQGAGRSARGRR